MLLVRLTSEQVRGCHAQEPVGYSFKIKIKVGAEKSLSFLSRHHASTISSSSRLGREVFLSQDDQARSTNYYFL